MRQKPLGLPSFFRLHAESCSRFRGQGGRILEGVPELGLLVSIVLAGPPNDADRGVLVALFDERAKARDRRVIGTPKGRKAFFESV